MTVSKADLMKKRFGVEEVEIPDVGTVKIRPLTRAEALELEGTPMEAIELDRKLLARGLVEPKLTEDEVAELQANTPAGLMQPVAKAIARLSGMEATAQKEAVKRFRS
jgi:hypothetical protein